MILSGHLKHRRMEERTFLSNQVSHLLVITGCQVLVGYRAEPWVHHRDLCDLWKSGQGGSNQKLICRVRLTPSWESSSCKSQAGGIGWGHSQHYGVLVLLRDRVIIFTVHGWLGCHKSWPKGFYLSNRIDLQQYQSVSYSTGSLSHQPWRPTLSMCYKLFKSMFVCPLRISHMDTMSLAHMHPVPPPKLLIDVPTSSSTFVPLFYFNVISITNFNWFQFVLHHPSTSVVPSPGAWPTYQGPHSCGKLTPSSSSNFSTRDGIWQALPPPSILAGLIMCSGHVQATLAAVSCWMLWSCYTQTVSLLSSPTSGSHDLTLTLAASLPNSTSVVEDKTNHHKLTRKSNPWSLFGTRFQLIFKSD